MAAGKGVGMPLPEQIARVVARCRAFYGARGPGHLLVNAQVPAEAPEIPPLNTIDLQRQLPQWLDYRLEAARAAWRAKEGLDDDSIPAICPQFGIAEHAAWLGLEVRLQATTCLTVPLLRKPEDLDRLAFSEQTPWFQYMRAGYEHLRRRQDGTFLLSVRGTVAPMDLANALRGDEFFTDLLLDPPFAHRLVGFCTQAIEWYYRRLRGWADEVEGGHIFAYSGSWLGPNALGHLSNDAAVLCSPAAYDAWGFPYERALAERFGRVLYHVHNAGLQHLPRLAQLPNLALLEVTDDPKAPPAIEDLPRVFAATGAANLLIHASSDQVRAHLGELQTRNVFLEVRCRDRADAEGIVALVRERSRGVVD